VKTCPSCAQLLRDETVVCSYCAHESEDPGAAAGPVPRGLSRSNYATIAVIVGSIGWVFMRAVPRAAAETLAAAGNAINPDDLPAATLLAYGTWIAAACFALAVGLAVVALFADPRPPGR
jgi:hypothetical protein